MVQQKTVMPQINFIDDTFDYVPARRNEEHITILGSTRFPEVRVYAAYSQLAESERDPTGAFFILRNNLGLKAHVAGNIAQNKTLESYESAARRFATTNRNIHKFGKDRFLDTLSSHAHERFLPAPLVEQSGLCEVGFRGLCVENDLDHTSVSLREVLDVYNKTGEKRILGPAYHALKTLDLVA